jgi:uncharacterized protein YbjT (DUF2867 family)
MAVSLLVAGATGLVGRHVVQQALADSRIGPVVALTRRPIAPAATLHNAVVSFDALPEDAPWWAADAVVCALGTTIKAAGSQEAFRRVDLGYTLEVARVARARGVPTLALVSAMGASARSPVFYSRVKGEVEEAVAALGFSSLTILRPGLIGGAREDSRPAEFVAQRVVGALGPLLPRRFRLNPAERIARALLDAVIQAAPGQRVVSSAELT